MTKKHRPVKSRKKSGTNGKGLKGKRYKFGRFARSVFFVKQIEIYFMKVLRKINKFINRFKFLKWSIRIFGWGSLFFTLFYQIGVAKLVIVISGLMHQQNTVDTFFYALDLKKHILAASPIKNILDEGIDWIFGLLSFGFLVSILDLEKEIEGAAYVKKPFPFWKTALTGYASFNVAQHLIGEYVFKVLVFLILISLFKKYGMIKKRADDPAELARIKFFLDENQILLSDGNLYNIVTSKVTRAPKLLRKAAP